jgi:hypothetical protein
VSTKPDLVSRRPGSTVLVGAKFDRKQSSCPPAPDVATIVSESRRVQGLGPRVEDVRAVRLIAQAMRPGRAVRTRGIEP